MEHIIQEHNLVDPLDFPTGEVVLHCMSCDDWVSTKDSEEVIAEFRNAPCPGARQHDDDEKDSQCIAGLKFYSQSRLYGQLFEVSESPPRDCVGSHKVKACYADATMKLSDGRGVCHKCHRDEMEITQSPPYCNEEWDDAIMRKHDKHSCYLDKGHKGGHICGFCVEGYDAFNSDDFNPVGQVPCASGCRCDHCNGTEQHEVEDNGLREAQNYLQSEELPDHLKKHVVDDDGGPVFGSSFYSHPDFKKKEDRT